MAKLQRKSAKVFAEQAQAAVGGIAQFGSLAAGNIQYSKDVDVIQALDAYKNGWASAVVGNKSPAMEDRNALDYLLSYQQAYIMQHGVPEWLSTETYYQNSYVVDSNGELRVSISDNNIGHDPIQDNGGQYWGYAGARGSGKQVGEVYFSQSSSATDNKGALPLFTGEVISNADNIYPQFYAWVLAHTSLCKTEAEYQTALSTYGECPFYVIDDTNKTIRLPKLVNYIKMANSTQGVTQSAAGLPNITGFINANYDLRVDGANDSALYSGAPTANNGRGNTSGSNTGIHFDASRSNAIYGNSNTVTPAHTTVFPWVFAFNAAIPASTAQAAEFQTALTGKADVDLSNLSVEGLSKFVGREFTPLNITVAQGGSGIAGTYTLTDLPDDGMTRLGLFATRLATTQSGSSAFNLQTDVMTSSAEVASTNNGFGAANISLLPIVREITISFPATGGGIGTGSRLIFLGYL